MYCRQPRSCSPRPAETGSRIPLSREYCHFFGDYCGSPGGGGRREKELADDVVELRDRVAAVDAHAKLRASLETLRVPAAQRADLVDHPPLPAASRRRLDPRGEGIRCG